MVFNSFAEFINMDGHGVYVWTCYAIAAALVAYNIISPKLLLKKQLKEHQRRNRREQL